MHGKDVLTCMDALMARAQGKDCSYNPFAFPPSLESCVVLGCCSWRNSTSSFPGVVTSDVRVGRLVVKA